MKSQAYRMTMLFDFYGDVLTDRQKEFYDLYYNEDLSLSEIAENSGISRQGVRDVIVRAEAVLTELEDKTKLIKRFHTIGCSAMARNVPGMMDGQIAQYVEEGLIFQADTLEELADKLGFDADAKANFLATVERYNELYDKQSDDDFGKMAPRLSAIRQAPFYGCWLGASLLTTEQGIAINENTQALDEDRNPIEGLYVTGDMSGSFFANNYPCLMPGIACGRTLTFAIKAVKQMGGLE